ncbi:MAG TPA: hypothetical protein VGF23_11670 [Gaiellaceae bacterium]|jgi:hypothetical protein
MPELWTPGVEGPHEAFVDHVHRQIARFAETAGVESPVVEVELADSARFVLDSMSAEPGFGFVTIVPHREPGDDDVPEALIVPVATIRRIELRRTPEEHPQLGFALPKQ